MKPVFVDTSGWVALLVKSDFHHEQASTIYSDLIARRIELITHEAILMELGNALAGRNTRTAVVGLLSLLNGTKLIERVALDDALIRGAWQLYSSRPDKDWGIVDCISFLLMQSRGLSEALTADKHFEQAGFVRLLNSFK